MSIQQVILTVARADNQVVVTLNGNIVYDKKTEGDPELNDSVNLTPLLASGVNHLTILGINWGGPAHYKGTLQLDSSIIEWGQYQGNPGTGTTWSRSFQITH